MPAFGSITYSGPQTVSLQGVAGTNQAITINLAGDPGTWDTLNIGIYLNGSGGGANNIFAGAEVALASSSASFPVITRFQYGDPFPSNPIFGSGSEILWGFGTGPADGDFFAAVMFSTFGTGPAYSGWIHLKVSNSSTSSPTITLIDWAYSDQPIAMGQGGKPTTLSSSANPAVLGQPVTLTATVSALPATPTGTVTFAAGATTLQTVALSSGQASLTISSLAPGTHSITAQYNGSIDFPPSGDTLSQVVTYGICALYDQTKSVHSGAVFPIKIALCNTSGADVSSPAIALHTTAVTMLSAVVGPLESPGNANPDNEFRFDGTLGVAGGYIFNIGTNALASGTYGLQFTATGDPVTHSTVFGVK
jgi:Bacterial Ig-like domain (group 3)